MEFTTYTLDNGLRILISPDKASPMVAMNLLYGIGSRDEEPSRTGFAHLFEHLMFGGSVNIPEYDTPLQIAGGENNAFTNNDFTNYYLTLPAQNLETAFWLESDRMLGLRFSEESLEVQRKVVIEEFRQRYLNQPYGDAWLHLRPLAYRVHPYQWPTIGMDISHIEGASLDEVRSFFFNHYAPNNCILTLAGALDPDQALILANQWFAPIEKRKVKERRLPAEPAQTDYRFKEIKGNVPAPAIYLAFHMGDRLSHNYYQCDLLSDILSSGMSSRLFLNLVKDKQLFSDIDAFITRDLDPGLFVVSGHLADQVNPEQGLDGIWYELNTLSSNLISQRELDKNLNRVESNLLFNNMSILSKAMNLAYYDWIGDPDKINHELGEYRSISREELRVAASDLFSSDNCSCLFYLGNGKQ